MTARPNEPTSELWVRSRRARAADVGDDLVLVARDGSIRRLADASAELARVVLGEFVRPRTRDDVVAAIDALADADDRPTEARRAVIHELVALLADTGVIEHADELAAQRTPAVAAANVVVCITGAIAASHAPALVIALQQRGYTVEVAVTPTATRFVALDALAAIVRRDIHTSMWPRAPHAPVPHVALARWAELVIVYPASATTIARIAAGDCSELVAAIATTTRAPVVVAPSMNDGMLDAPAVQRNLALLRADGRTIVHGVPAGEAADAPSLRAPIAAAAPAPADVVALVDALRAAGVLAARAGDWDAAYRASPLAPWVRDDCDADVAAALATHAPRPRRVLDVGCGLGQVARHAAALGHRVVAIDVSAVALALARERSGSADIVWLRDDICATALAGEHDVVVDRATLHALPRDRARAWAAAMRTLVAPAGHVIAKCHARGVPGATIGYTAADLAALLAPDFDVVSEAPAELPGLVSAEPIASLLVVLQRRARPAR